MTPQPSQVPSWTQFASQIPENLPDDAYDALREKFFSEHVAPDMLRQGFGVESARQEFMKRSERADKAKMPRAELVGKEALSSLVAPIAGVIDKGAGQEIQDWANKAAVEAERQGVTSWPYQMAGSMIGAAPYWGVGLGEAEGVAQALKAGPLLHKAIKTAAGGMIQGTYDLMKTGNVIEGLKGSVMGAGMVAGFESLGPLAKFLMGRGVSPEAAAAVEKVAKGTADDANWQTAISASLEHGSLDADISAWVGEQIKASKQAGVAKELVQEPLEKQLKVAITGADGKLYQLGGAVGMKLDDVEKIISRVSDHLQNGGSIEQIKGSPKAVSQFYQILSRSNPETFDLELALRPAVKEAPPVEAPTLSQINDEAITLSKPPRQDSLNGSPPLEVLENLRAVLGSDRGATLLDPSVNVMDSQVQRIVQAGQQKGWVLKTAPDGTRAFGEPKLVQRLLQQSQMKAGMDLNALINARDSYYHATDLEGFKGILEEGRIRPQQNDYHVIKADLTASAKREYPEWSDKEVAQHVQNQLAGIPGYETDLSGVSTSRSPRVASKADKAITFVIDRSKMPKTRPYVEEGYGKTIPEGEDAFGEPLIHEPVLPGEPTVRNPRFEFEQRTFNEDIPLSAVRGVIVDREALRTKQWMSFEADAGSELNAQWAALDAAGREDEARELVRSWNQNPGRFSTRANQQVEEALTLARQAGIPIKIMESGREVHSYRAGLQKQPEGMRWAMSRLGEEGEGGLLMRWGSDNVTQMPEFRSGDKVRLLVEPDDRTLSSISESGKYVEDHRFLPIYESREGFKVTYETAYTAPGPYGQLSHGHISSPTLEGLKASIDEVWDRAHAAKEARGSSSDFPIPDYDKLETLPTGEVQNKLTGEISFDPNQIRYKETPLSHRLSGDIPEDIMPGSATAVTLPGGEGMKPTIAYKEANKELIFHENLHGHFNYLGLDDWIDRNLNSDPLAHEIFNGAFPPEAVKLYQGGPIGEEVFNYAASAVRTGNDQLLERFGEANYSKEHVLQWTTERSKDLLDAAAEKADSLHKRTLERRLTAVISRATNQLDDINKPLAPSDVSVDIVHGRYAITDGESTHYFDYRQEAAEFLEWAYQEPLQAPELVPTQGIPDGLPRFALKVPASSNKPPVLSDPPDPEVLAKTPIKAGTSAFSFFVRPFYDWLADVSSKFDRPELYTTFEAVDTQIKSYNNAIRPYLQTLRETLGHYKHDRQTDFFKLLQAAEDEKPFLQQELRFTPKELADYQRFKDDFVDKLGGPFVDYIQKDSRALKDAKYDYEQVFQNENAGLAANLLYRGSLDPRDTNLIRLASIFLRAQKHGEIVEPALKVAEQMANEKIDGQLALGQIAPLLKRQIAYIRGTPDFTQTAVANAVQATVDAINQGIEKVNGKLPEKLQIPSIGGAPEDAMHKWITFTYAGMMGLRPGMLVRNTMQLFLTSFPLLGSYTFKGMERAFEVAKEGGESNAFRIAQRYGAFVEKANLHELVAGGGDFGVQSNLAEKVLEPIRWTDNATRLITFWGHADKIMDALRKYAGTKDVERFVKDSDAWFMNEGMRGKYVRELANLHENSWEDYSRRMAADLTDQSQWNFRKGATPGLYRWQLGRLFGQFGTWPLNYIEYARRLMQGSDKTAAMQAVSRLVLAHGATLAAGQAIGVDTSNWVFFDPMAYGGGPIMQSVVNAPSALSSTPQGAEARHQLRQLFIFPGQIPGGQAMEQIWKGASENDQALFTRMMGFTPLKGQQQ